MKVIWRRRAVDTLFGLWQGQKFVDCLACGQALLDEDHLESPIVRVNRLPRQIEEWRWQADVTNVRWVIHHPVVDGLGESDALLFETIDSSLDPHFIFKFRRGR